MQTNATTIAPNTIIEHITIARGRPASNNLLADEDENGNKNIIKATILKMITYP